MNYVNNGGNFNQRQPNNPYSNTYNLGWRNHLNFSWSNQQNQPINKQQGYKPPMTMESMMQGFLVAQQQHNELIKQLTSRMDQLATHNKMLENQIVQQASSSSKAAGKLPSQPEMNPREHCKAVTLKSGRTLVQSKKEPTNETLEKSEILQKLYINIPFTEALSQMPSYAKFLKEILSKKRKLEDYGTVALIEECSAILQNKLPPKLKDLGKIGKLRPTTISLQLADRYVKYPVGIFENIPIKVREEEVEFNLFDTIKHKFEPDECFKVDIIDK
ncbi:hypothetical protein P3X46_016972 [Hevea brasiliensis]|uniref:Uncharacterized protein n=1 Tax=Hevea brasiliensis TaxID=3981 RepID=A0ABQ9M2W3_HEVBR|nr:hypothetical protein P3X46_016972 [Hevea brasiliensis]